MLPKQQPVKVKYRVIDRLKEKYGVCVLCRYLGCSRSGYYDWVKRGKPSHNKICRIKAEAISQIYHARPSRGRRQVMMQLERQYDIYMCLGSVHRYMKILGLQSIRKRKYSAPAKEMRKSRTFPNVLKQDFRVSAGSPAKWVTDVTYLPCKDGTLYLSCIKDLCDKSIVAYAISNKNDLRLVMSMMKKAAPHIRRGGMIHSDQGAQYRSPVYHEFLKQYRLTGSMSRKGTPYDNAPIESFFSILKNEALKPHGVLTSKQMRVVVEDFICFYNDHRPQIALQKLTPAEYRSQFR